MISDGMGRGGGGSAKSDFISKGSLIQHLMRGGGESKKTKNYLISYIYGRSLTGNLTLKKKEKRIRLILVVKMKTFCLYSSCDACN